MTTPGAPVLHPVEDPFKACPPLKPADRCDRCSVSSAAIRLVSPGGRDILLCSHHYGDHADALATQNFTIVSTTGNLSGARL